METEQLMLPDGTFVEVPTGWSEEEKQAWDEKGRLELLNQLGLQNDIPHCLISAETGEGKETLLEQLRTEYRKLSNMEI